MTGTDRPTHPSPPERWHALVEGIVQGVGFRYFVRDAAVARGLTGWVRNRTDGSVEVVAEGPRSSLETFESEVRRGPRASRVDRVEPTWSSATGEYSGFRLLPTA